MRRETARMADQTLKPSNGTQDAPGTGPWNAYRSDQAGSEGPWTQYGKQSAPVDAAPAEAGFIPTVKRTAGQMMTTAATSADDVVGPNAVTKSLRETGQGIIDRNPAGITSLSDVVDKPWLAVKEAAGQFAPQIAAHAAGAAAGAALGSVVPGVGTAVGALLGGVAPVAVQEYGGIRQDQIASGQEDKGRALMAAVPATALELVGLGKASKVLRGIPIGAGSIAKEVGKGVLKEGATEGAQNVIEQVGAFKDPTTSESLGDTGLAAVMGGIGGGIMGGAGGAVDHLRNQNTEARGPVPEQAPGIPPETPPETAPTQAEPFAPAEPTIEVGPDGVARTAADRSAGNPDIPNGDPTDVTPAPPEQRIAQLEEKLAFVQQQAQANGWDQRLIGARDEATAELDALRPAPEVSAEAPAIDQRPLSQQMGIDPNTGPLSSAAAMAVDSGAHAQAQQDQALQAAADAAQKQRPAKNQEQTNVSNAGPFESAVPGVGGPGGNDAGTRLRAANTGGVNGGRGDATGARPLALSDTRTGVAPANPAISDAPLTPSNFSGTPSATMGSTGPTAQQGPSFGTKDAFAAIRASKQAVQPQGATSEPKTDQAQQSITQPTQAGGAATAGPAATTAAGQPATVGGRGGQAAGVSNATTAQNAATSGKASDGQPAATANTAQAPKAAQAAPAPVAQAAPTTSQERHPNWRKNAIQAGRVARELGLEPKGKRLAQIVAEVDAKDAEQNQAVAPISKAQAATENVAKEGALDAGLKAIPAAKVDTPAQGVLNNAQDRKEKAFKRLKTVRQQVKDGTANRLQLIKAESAHKDAVREVDSARAQIEADANKQGLTTVRATEQKAKSTPTPATPEPVAKKESAPAAPAPQGREVSREIGKYKEGMSEPRANQVRSELARKNPGVVYTVEEDAALKNGYVVVGRETAPGKKLGVEKMQAAKGRAPVQFSRALPEPQDFVFGQDANDSLSGQGAMFSRAKAVDEPSVSDNPEKWRGLTDRYQKDVESTAEKIGSVGGYALMQDTTQNYNQDEDGQIYAIDKSGNVAGVVFFGRREDGKLEAAVEVSPNARRKGIASAMYDAIESMRGEKLAPAARHTKYAEAFWANRDGSAAKTTQTGNADIRFSRAQAISRPDSNARNVATQLLVDGLKAKWTRAPEIIVARNMDDPQIPQDVREEDARLKSQGSDGEARGFIYRGKVYLLSDQLKGPEQIAETLFHEVLGHYGLRGTFGEGLTPILQQLGTMRRKDVVTKAREYGLYDKDKLGGISPKQASDAQIWAAMSAKDRLSAAEEVLAEMAQTQPTIGFVKRAIALIRNWLRANVPGFKSLRLTDSDIVAGYILPARGFVTRSNETPQQSIERAMLAFSRVWHGSPHKFLQFDSSKIGTGEGAQAYGHGIYLAESPGVADAYRSALSPKTGKATGSPNIPADSLAGEMKRAWLDGGSGAVNKKMPPSIPDAWKSEITRWAKAADDMGDGNLYQVDLPDDQIAKMLDWDKPLSEQKPVMAALDRAGYKPNPSMTAGEFIKSKQGEGFAEYLSEDLRKQGIPGIRYLDGGSRGNGTGTSNYVIFPGMEKILTIIDVNGEPVTGAEKAKVLGEQMDMAFSRTAADQTQTEAFKKWFGKSVVVDADGKPLASRSGLVLARKAAMSEGRPDSNTSNAKPLADLLVSKPFSLEGLGGLEVPAQREVLDGVISLGDDLKILRSVVEFIPVDVVDILSSKNLTPEMLFSDKSVLKKILAADHDGSVTTAVKVADALVVAVARMAAKWSLIDARMTASNREQNAASSTGVGNGFHGDIVSQIKTTGNNGNFDPTNPDIRFSRTSTATQSAWDAPLPSSFDDIVYKMQDKHIDTKRVVDAITAKVGQIKDAVNVYLQEELFHGRAAKRVADFGAMELKPVLNQMRMAGLSLDDVEEFLHARHAKEANALIAQREPGMPDGGSGMTNQAADDYMKSLTADQKRRLEAVASKVDSIIGKTRQMYADYGLEDQKTVDGWGTMFANYVPLMREGKDGGMMGIGQGFTVKGKEVKGRTGSTRKVVDILANIAAQREKVIVRGEKNRVATALVGLAAANPNKEFWETRSQPPTERVYDAKTDSVVDRPDSMFKQRPNVVTAKVKDSRGNVTEQSVVFNEDDPRAMRMAAALKNLDAGQLEGLLGVSAKITRYFSAINTQYNPVFGVVNLVRDVQGAMVNLGSTELAGQQGKIAKNTLPALAGIYKDVRAARQGKQPTSKWSALWDQMQEDGGTTGYRDLFSTTADRANSLKNIIDPNAWADGKWGKVFTANGKLKVPLSVAKQKAGVLFDWLSDYNEAMENGVRLAAYSAALDNGMTRAQAASLSKNLTVNFNRKGQVGQQAGALYAFFNAAMQGTARIGQTLFEMDGGDYKTIRLSSTGKKVIAGGLALGSIQAMMLAAAGFGDDEPPDFVRERSLVIPTGGKGYISIPMPLGLHVIPGLGRHATEFALNGFKDPAKRAISIFGMLADAFNPIGNAGLSMQTLAPTALDPLVALTENKDWTGKPIARTSSNKAVPGHSQWKDTASSPAKWISEAINTMSGGDKYVAGALSPTPDQIDYLFAQVTGGVGRELAKVEQTAGSFTKGEELPTYKVPLVGRFYGNAGSQASEGTAFYASVNKLNEIETKAKAMRKDGKFNEAAEYLRSEPDAPLILRANAAERQIQKLKRDKRDLIEKGADREQVRAKEEQITAVMANMNRAVEARRALAKQ